MKKLPLDVSDFNTMIKGDYVYVDKTQYIYNLVTEGRFYFLSRPRRFGKSLLISTLKELFSGNKELFKDQIFGFYKVTMSGKYTLLFTWIFPL
jgi:hypothetical protein